MCRFKTLVVLIENFKFFFFNFLVYTSKEQEFDINIKYISKEQEFDINNPKLVLNKL